MPQEFMLDCCAEVALALKHPTASPLVQAEKPQIVIGYPTSGHHNVTIWVYIKALQQLVYQNIKIITYAHPQLYPMFTGGEPVKDGNGIPVCEETGCAELCRAHGFSTSPCVDIVGSSDIPVNHATWLEDFQDQYDVSGTAYEEDQIGLFAPDYAPFNSLSGAVASNGLNKTIFGFLSGPADGCDTAYCPKCAGQPFITDSTGPIQMNNFVWKGFSCPDFESIVADKLAKRESFLVEMWVPMFWNARFPELHMLDMEQYLDNVRPNQGKILIRKDRKYKLDAKALSVLSAIFIGNKNVNMMDGWANGFGVDEPLCDYWDFDHGCAAEASQKWIDENRANKLWDSFFW